MKNLNMRSGRVLYATVLLTVLLPAVPPFALKASADSDISTQPQRGKESAINQSWSESDSREPASADVRKRIKLFEDPERKNWQKPSEIIKFMNIKAGDIIADIGGGTGYFARRFAFSVGSSGKVFAIDTEPGMVNYMKEDARLLGLKNYEARLSKPRDPGLEPSSVDMVFMCNTYFQIKNTQFLKNLSKTLKKKGRIFLIDFHKTKSDSGLSIGPPEFLRIPKEEVLDHFKEAGYTLKRDINLLEYQYFLEFVP